ncbi:MAG: trypsin-like peptidase domain-containing protein [Anaerolineae bacterium]|nr:S1C family serine protease [Thermoflexales bacterium]MCX7940057.1 S1C family serine protease [Thermoflexales bacterium]MDW8053975.1 trypsin-like peptidase domain-containing protein [Anaerolineae bacterium]MDW8293097.1 trypsin-like peptidase domain-containing protein [Anaerolineae bacterium]
MTSGMTIDALSAQMADAVEQVGRSLVTVYGRARQPATGMMFADELVLTADHVLEREEGLSVRSGDGARYAASIVGRDPFVDLAVLRVAGLRLPLVRAADGARVGQFVLAVARPNEQGVMASLGVVSKIAGPLRLTRGTLERVIQTDALPYPGFSGGALIDTSSGVIGLFTSGLVRGLSLAIPMDIALRLAEALVRHGRLQRGYLGVVTQSVKLPARQRFGERERGLLVVRVEEDSPAERGGLLVGDLILTAAGQAIQSAEDLVAQLSADRIGQPLTIEVLRGGVVQAVSVVVGTR